MQVPEQTLTNVVREVLETMAFTFVMPGESEFDGGGDVVRAMVRFAGPFSGEVLLTVPAVMLPELAANMLGEDDAEPSAEQQRDAIGELANVMCGNLVQTLAGPEPTFRLQSPCITAGDAVPGPRAPGARVVSARVPLENGWAELSIVLDGEWSEVDTAVAGVALEQM